MSYYSVIVIIVAFIVIRCNPLQCLVWLNTTYTFCCLRVHLHKLSSTTFEADDFTFIHICLRWYTNSTHKHYIKQTYTSHSQAVKHTHHSRNPYHKTQNPHPNPNQTQIPKNRYPNPSQKPPFFEPQTRGHTQKCFHFWD